MKRRGWFARNALGLWLLGIAALGAMRFWMKWREAAGMPLALDAWLWLGGTAICALAGTIALLRRLS